MYNLQNFYFLKLLISDLPLIWSWKSCKHQYSYFNVIDRLDQCDLLQNIQMVPVFSEYIMTEDGKVNTALRKTENVCYCLSHVNVNFFWFSFLIEMENSAFAISMAVYYVPKTMLMWSSKVSRPAAIIGAITWLNLP